MRAAAVLAALLVSAPLFAQSPGSQSVVVPELAVDPVGYEMRITLEWSAPDGQAVSEYLIYRQPADGSDPVVIDTVGPLTTQYFVTGHTEGDVYTVQAHAYGPRSEGALPWCDEPTDEV